MKELETSYNKPDPRAEVPGPNEGQIAQAIRHLDSELERQSNVISELFKKLDPILHAVGPTKAGESEGDRAMCQAARVLTDFGKQLEVQTNSLISILERTEL